MQVYRGLPILTNQSPGAARRDLAARPRGLGRRVPAAGARGDRRDPRGGRDADRRRRHGPLPARGARRPVAAAGAGAGRARALGAALRRRGRRERARALAELDPEAAAAVHPNDRRRVVRSLELAGRDARARPPLDRRHAPPDDRLRARRPEGGARPPDRRADASDVRGRRARGGGARARRPESRRRPPTRTGSPTSPSTPTTRTRSRRSSARTRRYAAYQRKWMRRIPGLVSLPADRPPGEVADAILEVARARQRLPAGRAG